MLLPSLQSSPLIRYLTESAAPFPLLLPTTTLLTLAAASVFLYYRVRSSSPPAACTVPPPPPPLPLPSQQQRLLAEHHLIQENTKFVTVRGKRLRVVYIEHELWQKVPLIVFVHGVGSQIAVWQHQIKKFAVNANILAIDLVGHGMSEVSSRWDDYTTESLVADLVAVIELFPSSSVILLSHSYGCTLSTFLFPRLPRIQALVYLTPAARRSEESLKKAQRVAALPDPVVDLIRWFDRIGGIHSPSVSRFLGKNADDALRERQLAWNRASRTSVFKRVIRGMTLPAREDLVKITCPLLLIGGADDKINPPVHHLSVLHGAVRPSGPSNPLPFVIPMVGHQPMIEQPTHCHAIIAKFLTDRFEGLNPEWQILQTKENDPNEKWSLKNYDKWCKTTPVSNVPVGPTPLRAMKVMRQVDPVHSPSAFLTAHPEVGTVIDISKDEPPYQTYDLSEKGIEYIKIASKSKSPPSREDVKRFIEAVNAAIVKKPDKQVAVHCHYGYNRTGFLICAYMIETQKIPIATAIRHFSDARPRGIRWVRKRFH